MSEARRTVFATGRSRPTESLAGGSIRLVSGACRHTLSGIPRFRILRRQLIRSGPAPTSMDRCKVRHRLRYGDNQVAGGTSTTGRHDTRRRRNSAPRSAGGPQGLSGWAASQACAPARSASGIRSTLSPSRRRPRHGSRSRAIRFERRDRKGIRAPATIAPATAAPTKPGSASRASINSETRLSKTEKPSTNRTPRAP